MSTPSARVPGIVPPTGCELSWLALTGAATPDRLALLSADEIERSERFAADRDRWAYVHTRAALRVALARHLGMAAHDVTFTTVGRGKPVLAGAAAASGVQFSVAHTDDIAAIAIADRPVGVDVERVRPEAWDAEMAALVLSPAELAWVHAQPSPDDAFFTCWCRKEAWVKTGADGLVDELAALTLTPTHEVVGLTLTHCMAWPGVLVACATLGN